MIFIKDLFQSLWCSTKLSTEINLFRWTL